MYVVEQVTSLDLESLVELRARSMKSSLEAVGRFDEQRVRQRLRDNFNPSLAFQVRSDLVPILFWQWAEHESHIYLQHLYVDPIHQNKGLGHLAVNWMKDLAKQKQVPLRLHALTTSPAELFYQNCSFVKLAQAEFDTAYEYVPH